MFNSLLDILLPKKCLGCSREGRYVCSDCDLFLSEAPVDNKGLMAVWQYEGLMEKLISKIRDEGKYDIINELVEKAFEKIVLELPKGACITYVPMSKKKEKQRGFNQSALIARKVGKMTKREVRPLLAKTKSGKHVFQNQKNADVPTNVLLVDDFLVSGATFDDCSRVLKESGARNVWGFVLARKI